MENLFLPCLVGSKPTLAGRTTHVLHLQFSPDPRLSNPTAPFSSRCISSWQVCRRVSRALGLAVADRSKWPPDNLDSLCFRRRNSGSASPRSGPQKAIPQISNRNFYHYTYRTKSGVRNL